MSLRILVTGGAGYLGSTLVPRLLEAGHEVTVLDNFMYGQGEALAACCHSDRFEVHRADVRELGAVKPHLARADVVIPLAAIVGAPACERDPVAALDTNRYAVVRMLASVSREQRVVFPTTNSAYGTGGAAPLDESAPLNAVSAYARQKVAVERVLAQRENAVSLRLATVYGMSPRLRLDLLVNDFVWRAVTERALVLFEGNFRRNVLHVRDAAAAFLHALDPDRVPAGVYNVGDSQANVSKRGLASAIANIVPSFQWVEAEAGRDPDRRDYVISNAKFEATGWRAGVALEAGLRELAKGMAMLSARRYGNV